MQIRCFMPAYKYVDGKGQKRWYFQGMYKGVHYCRRVWDNKPMFTKMEALNAEYYYLAQRDFKEANTPLQQRFLYEIWDEYVETKVVKESTKPRFIMFKNNYLNSIGNTRLDCMKASTLLDWRKKLDKKKITVESKNKILAFMRNLIQYGIDVYKMPNNLLVPLREPFKDYSIKKHDTKQIIYTEDEFNKFINTFDNNYLGQLFKLLFSLLFYTGMRISELMALRWQDYKYDGKIHVYRQWQVINKVGQFTSPKTSNSNRFITLDDITRKQLEDFIDLSKRIVKGFRTDWFMFYGSKPYNEQKIRRICKEHSDIAKLPHIKLHGFRHSHATYLRNMGYDEWTISQRLGNEPKTASKTYIHASQIDDEEVATKIQRKS